jgi:hypothetical protein
VATHQGKVHDYLGMIFKFSAKGKVMVNMIEYIKNIVTNFPEEITALKTSPAADHFLKCGKNWKLSHCRRSKQWHFIILLPNCYSWVHAQGTTYSPQPLFTTREKSPDQDNWGKVKKVHGYLKGAVNMPLVLAADSLTLSWWWVDAAYAVHHDHKGHTGTGMSFRQGMALSYSWKQKIVAKSSTEAELVGVDDTYPGVHPMVSLLHRGTGFMTWTHQCYIKKKYVRSCYKRMLKWVVQNEQSISRWSISTPKKHWQWGDQDWTLPNGKNVDGYKCKTKSRFGVPQILRPCHGNTRGLQWQRLLRNHSIYYPSQFDAAGTQGTESITGVWWG